MIYLPGFALLNPAYEISNPVAIETLFCDKKGGQRSAFAHPPICFEILFFVGLMGMKQSFIFNCAPKQEFRNEVIKTGFPFSRE